MFKWAKEEGVLKHEDWALYDLSHAVMELPTVSADVVEKYYAIALRAFYFRPSYMIKRFFGMRTVYDIKINIKAFLGIVATAIISRLNAKN